MVLKIKIGYLNYENIANEFHIYPNSKANWKSTVFEEAIKNDIPLIVTEWSSSAGLIVIMKFLI